MSSRHVHLVAAVSGLLFGFDPAVINGAPIFLRRELAEIRDTIAGQARTLAVFQQVTGISTVVYYGPLIWRVMPETKGRSLEEVERSW